MLNLVLILLILVLIILYDLYLLMINHFCITTQIQSELYTEKGKKKAIFSVMLQAESILVTKDVSNQISKCKNEISFQNL